MQRSLSIILVLCGTMVLAGRLGADDKSDKEQALEQVKKLKGTVTDFPFGISFDGKGITDDNLSVVEKLPDLGALYLRKCKVTDKGLEHVKSLTKLKYLFLGNNDGVTDKGIEIIKNLPALENLSLTGTQVTDEGLAQLKGVKTLKVLEVKNTKVTEAGIADFKKALPNVTVR